MDDQDFMAMIDRHGADAGRWPDDRRAAALALLQRSATARGLLGETAELERLLRARAAPTAVAPAPAMAARAMRARQVPAAAALMRRVGFGLAAVLVLAAGLAIGADTGRGAAAGSGVEEAPSQVLAAALGVGGRDGGGEGASDVD